MGLSVAEIQEIRERHYRIHATSFDGRLHEETYCAACDTEWPCETVRLLSEIDRLQTNREVVAATAYESGYQAAVREVEAREAALVKVIERAEGPMHMYYEEHHKDGHNCQCLICMTVNHYDREAMSGADGLSKAREALAAGSEGEGK
jgi:hypothetical protein